MNIEQAKAMTSLQWAEMASKLRGESSRREREKQESFERCDTGGFLSQWSLGLSAERDRAQARICDDHGRSSFPGLYQGDRRVRARMITKQFGHRHVSSWLLHESETELRAARGKPFIPVDYTGNSKIQKALGLMERPEEDWAWAKIEGRGTGLSGTCWVEIYRMGDKWGADAILDDEHNVNQISELRAGRKPAHPEECQCSECWSDERIAALRGKA